MLSALQWFSVRLAFPTYIPFLACQKCRLNQRRNENVRMKKSAVDIFKNGGPKDLARSENNDKEAEDYEELVLCSKQRPAELGA